jgi:hypothetical protein
MKKLESKTGYLKSLVAVYDEYPVYDHAIYIPDGAEKNYTEATKEEFEAYKKKQEEKAKNIEIK